MTTKTNLMMVNSATVADRQGQDTNCKVRLLCDHIPTSQGFPCGSAVKESACNVGDLGLIPGLGRSPGEGNGYPLQYSDLENSMDCIVHGVGKSRTRLSNFHSHQNQVLFLEVSPNLPAQNLGYGKVLITPLCPTLCDPMDCSPPGSLIYGISQARILEWVAMPFSRGSSQLSDRTRISYISCIGGQVLYQ